MLSLRLLTTMHGKNPVQSCLNTLGKTFHWWKNPVQSCLRDFKQHSTRENPVQCYLNTLGTTSHRSNTVYNVFREISDNIAKEKNLAQCCRCTPGTTSHRKNPMQCYPKRSRQYCTRKIQCNVVWIKSGHFLAIFILNRLIFW